MPAPPRCRGWAGEAGAEPRCADPRRVPIDRAALRPSRSPGAVPFRRSHPWRPPHHRDRAQVRWMALPGPRWRGLVVEPPRYRSEHLVRGHRPGVARPAGLRPVLRAGGRPRQRRAGVRKAAVPLRTRPPAGRGLHSPPGRLRRPGSRRHGLAARSRTRSAAGAAGPAGGRTARDPPGPGHQQRRDGPGLGGRPGRSGGRRDEAEPALRRRTGPTSRGAARGG